MRIEEYYCKTALSPSTLPGLDYSLNPYIGCQHNCAYCYGPNILHINRNQWGSAIKIKKNIPTLLAKELKKKPRGIVGLSTVTDPYQPVEEKHKLTRFCLEQLLKYDFPLCIQTKSSLLKRDLSLLKQFSTIELLISIGTLNDTERQVLEPYSASIPDRLSLIKTCNNKGVETSVFFGPIYPTISLYDISAIIDTFVDHGAQKIFIDTFHFKPGILTNLQNKNQFSKQLQDSFSNMETVTNTYYKKLQKELHTIGRERKIKIINAF